jgi:hypothetical protein
LLFGAACGPDTAAAEAGFLILIATGFGQGKLIVEMRRLGAGAFFFFPFLPLDLQGELRPEDLLKDPRDFEFEDLTCREGANMLMSSLSSALVSSQMAGRLAGLRSS